MANYSVVANFMAADNVSGIVGGMADNLRSFGDQSSASMEKASGGFDLLGVAAGAGIAAVAAAVEIGVNQFLQVNDAMAKMGARLNYTDDWMKKYEQTAKDLFNTGLVDNFNQAADAVEKTAQKVKGLSQTDLSHFLTDAAGVGKVWGESAGNVAETVGKIQAQFKEMQDANGAIATLNILAATAQQSGKPLQEIETTVTRLGPKFAAAGLSAYGMGGLIVMAAQAGISQNGMAGLSTAVDTFHQKVSSPDAAFRTGLRELGLSSVTQDLATNKITMDQALDDVFKALDKVKDPAEKNKVAMELFGKSIDKIGGPDALSSMAGFSTKLGDISTTADTVTTKMQALPETAFGQIKNKIVTLLGDIVESASGALLQLPTIFIAGFTGAWAAVVVWGANIMQKLKDLWKWVGDTAKAAWDNVVTVFNNAVGAVSGAVSNIVNAVMGVLQPMINAINSAVAGIAAIAGFGGGGGPSGPTTPYAPGQGLGAHRASGGPLAKDGLTLVGEQGPELIDGTTGMVYSNNQSKTILGSMGGGGGGMQVTVNLDGATVIDVNTFMNTVYKQIQIIQQRRGLIS